MLTFISSVFFLSFFSVANRKFKIILRTFSLFMLDNTHIEKMAKIKIPNAGDDV